MGDSQTDLTCFADTTPPACTTRDLDDVLMIKVMPQLLPSEDPEINELLNVFRDAWSLPIPAGLAGQEAQH